MLGLRGFQWLNRIAAQVAVSSSQLRLLQHILQKVWFEPLGSDE